MELQKFKNEFFLDKDRNINENEIYEKTLKKFNEKYSIIFMEELSELIQAIAKKEREIEDADYMLLEELADVEIVIDLMKRKWNISNEDIKKAKKIKLEQLKTKRK